METALLIGCSLLAILAFAFVMERISYRQMAIKKRNAQVTTGIIIADPETTSDKYGYKVTNLTLETSEGRRSYNFDSTGWLDLQGAVFSDEVEITAFIQSTASKVYAFKLIEPD